MKELKQLPAASFLICLLTISTFGGIIDYPAPPPPPPSPESVRTNSDIYIPGDIYVPGSSDQAAVDVTLKALQLMLLVF